MSNEPSFYVRPDVSDARVERVWAAVRERAERRKRVWLRPLSFAVAIAATAGAVSWFSLGPAREQAPLSSVQDGAQLQTGSEALAVTLKDGTALSLAPRTQAVVRSDQPSSVLLELSRGELRCEVTHRPGRSFIVRAADLEVRVVGTRFTVSASPGSDTSRVEVSVQQGVVEIRSARQPGLVTRVGAGQTYAQGAELPPSPPATHVTAEPAPVESTKREASKPPIAPPSASSASGPTARELFEKAGERRRGGDAAGAARAYEELLRAHPGDARVGLAAFELGRLRMDRLGDPAGAIPLLERAVASSLGPSFREDALARLVSAYAGQGNFAACGRARDRYLQSYPHGVHATAVASRCGAR